MILTAPNSSKCRVSYGAFGHNFYCDYCGKYFDKRNEPPCGEDSLPQKVPTTKTINL